MTVIAFLSLASLGSIVRWVLTQSRLGEHRGTFIVNILGSFLLGLINNWSEPGIIILGVGAIGSLTTFSAFIAGIFLLTEKEKTIFPGAIYITLTIIAGVLAALLGLFLADI